VSFQKTGSHQQSVFILDKLSVSGVCGISGALEEVPELRSASCQVQTQGVLSVPPIGGSLTTTRPGSLTEDVGIGMARMPAACSCLGNEANLGVTSSFEVVRSLG